MLDPRNNNSLTFSIDKYLAYITGSSVIITDSSAPTTNTFEARVSSYDFNTGVIVLDNIVNITGFLSGITSTFNINLDGIDGPTEILGLQATLGPTGPTGVREINI